MSSPRATHWNLLEQILCYRKGSPGRGVLYKNHGHCKVEGFSDTNWAGSKIDRSLQQGTAYLLVVI